MNAICFKLFYIFILIFSFGVLYCSQAAQLSLGSIGSKAKKQQATQKQNLDIAVRSLDLCRNIAKIKARSRAFNLSQQASQQFNPYNSSQQYNPGQAFNYGDY